jgi:hypothetical protein
LTSKSVATVFSGLASKLVVTVSPGLASKSMARVSRFVPQNRQLQFGDLGIKITVMVSWFVQNQWREYGVGHASRSGGLLHLEASRAMIFQSALKSGGGATVGDACSTITKIASGSS